MDKILKKDNRPEILSKLPKKDYDTFKNAVIRLCDDMLKQDIEPTKKAKIAWFRSRLIIEL